MLRSFCLLLVSLCCQGLELSMDRDPGYYGCGRLQCVSDVTGDTNILTILGMTVYDVSQSKTKLKIASLSFGEESFYTEPSKVDEINGTGSITRYQANITLDFRNQDDCAYGSFQCELDFMNITGQYNVIYETTEPRSQYNECQSVMTYQMKDMKNEMAALREQSKMMEAKLDTLLGLFNSSVCHLDLNLTQGTSTSKISCTKGMTSTSSREHFMLWDRIQALCDTDTDGGGWIIIQRRTKGDVEFYRNWADYKNGFGTPDTDFWIGNDVIHDLTSQGYTELRVDLEYNGNKYFAHYSNFSVGDEVSKYKLSVSGYSGTAGDSLTYHDGMKFSTFDQDNDLNTQSCAEGLEGAWWYKICYYSNLNGLWGKDDPTGVVWGGIVSWKSVSSTEMKIRHV